MNLGGNAPRYSRVALAVLLAAALLIGCSEAVNARSFVGKWKSSRLTAPVHLYENGDWEIRGDDGTVQQFGIWAFRNNTVIWTYMNGTEIEHDPNAVVSVTQQKFEVRERDRSITSFVRLPLDRAAP